MGGSTVMVADVNKRSSMVSVQLELAQHVPGWIPAGFVQVGWDEYIDLILLRDNLFFLYLGELGVKRSSGHIMPRRSLAIFNC